MAAHFETEVIQGLSRMRRIVRTFAATVQVSKEFGGFIYVEPPNRKSCADATCCGRAMMYNNAMRAWGGVVD